MTILKLFKTHFFTLLSLITLLPRYASAHEAYVIPTSIFQEEIKKAASIRALEAFKNPHNITLSLEITAGILTLIFLNFLFRQTRLGLRTQELFERFSWLGPAFVRITIAAAFFAGARSGAFLGPELSLTQMPFATILRWGLEIASIMIVLGLFTEIAALFGLIAFTLGFFAFGSYLFTYLNYLGELIVLILFGMRTVSIDRIFFGPLKSWRAQWEPYETTIVRICYGFALIYAGITVKFLHPDLTLKVINDWNLTQFHWLFPSDPLLVVFGAGLAESVIGLFIIFGFEMRMTVFISLFYITLSLLYFRELVWPHILLYGISLNLLVQPEIFTLDHLLFEKYFKEKSIWQRILSSHRELKKD